MPALGLALDDVDADEYPLIGFLLGDPDYRGRYVKFVAQVASDVFTPARMRAIYQAKHALLAAYLQGVGADDDLESLREATDGLIAHVQQRAAAVAGFLASQG